MVDEGKQRAVLSVLYDTLSRFQRATDLPAEVAVGSLDLRLSAIYLAVERELSKGGRRDEIRSIPTVGEFAWPGAPNVVAYEASDAQAHRRKEYARQLAAATARAR